MARYRPLLLALGAGTLFGLLLWLSWLGESSRRRIADAREQARHVDHLLGRLDVVDADDPAPRAPAFSAPTVRGDDVVLRAYRGGALLLAFARLEDGAPDEASRRMLADVAKVARDLAGAGLNVAVCVPAGRERAAAIAEELGIGAECRVMCALGEAERRALGLRDELLPTAMVIDKRGRVIAGAPAVEDGAARFAPMPFRPSASQLVSLLGEVYEELANLSALTALTAHREILPETARLEPVREDGVCRGLFRAEAADGRTTGWVRAAHPEIRCRQCRAPRMIITLDAEHEVKVAQIINEMWDGRDPVPYTAQFRGLKRADRMRDVRSDRAREDALRAGERPIDLRVNMVGATRSAESAFGAVRQTRAMVERIDAASRAPASPSRGEATAQ